MKKIFASVLVLLLILSLSSCFITEELTQPPRLEEPWQIAYLSLITERYEEVQKREGFVSLSYALLDLTSDGTPELFFSDKNDNSVYTYQNDSVIELIFPEAELYTQRYPLYPYAYRDCLTNEIRWFYHIGEEEFGASDRSGYTELVFDPETLQPTLYEHLRLEWSDSIRKDNNVSYVDPKCFVKGEPVALEEYEQALWEWNKAYWFPGILYAGGLYTGWNSDINREAVTAVLAAWEPLPLPELPLERSEVAFSEIHTAPAPPTEPPTTEPMDER